MSSGDVMVREGRIVNYEEAKCVWRLECPFCGWLFGFCLDMTHKRVYRNQTYLVHGKVRKPTHRAKIEGGRRFVYFKRRRRSCARCRAFLVPEDDLPEWLSSNGSKQMELDDLGDLICEMDPDGRVARICSDRVYDISFEEWGTDGMPYRYLAILNKTELLHMICE